MCITFNTLELTVWNVQYITQEQYSGILYAHVLHYTKTILLSTYLRIVYLCLIWYRHDRRLLPLSSERVCQPVWIFYILLVRLSYKISSVLHCLSSLFLKESTPEGRSQHIQGEKNPHLYRSVWELSFLKLSRDHSCHIFHIIHCALFVTNHQSLHSECYGLIANSYYKSYVTNQIGDSLKQIQNDAGHLSRQTNEKTLASHSESER